MNPTIIGSAGVAILLAAYALNQFGKMAQTGGGYLSMNLVGSGMAAWYAWAGGNVPFVILEGAWAVVSLVQLFTAKRKDSRG